MNAGPLAGFTIGVTADRRADEQMRLLAGRGAECVHGPVIRTHPVDCDDDLRLATEAVISDPPDLVVLTTGLGVRSWMEAADALQLGEELRATLQAVEVWARGPKAKGAAATVGFDVAWNAPNARYDDIVATLAERRVAGRRIAVQLDGAGARDLCHRLAGLGAEVLGVPVYRWSLPDDVTSAERLVRAVCERRVDAVTFTARPAVENFLAIGEALDRSDELAQALSGPVATFCVGPVCAEGLLAVGLGPPLVPERHRLGALVQLVTRHFARQAGSFALGGVNVQLQGRRVLVQDEQVCLLTDRERALLEVLIERPGAVHAKSALLERVWGPDESDTHVVEVTIGRLRQRLGPAGAGIETVLRRGYRTSAH